MRHPLEFLPLNLRKPFFFVFLGLTILVFGVFGVLDQSLRTDAAPFGIVSFELAGSPQRAFQILVSWEGVCADCPAIQNFQPYLYAAFGLGLDYLFMPAYALALSLGLLMAGAGRADWHSRWTAVMGWGAFAAALFDALENYALWKILTGSVAAPFPQIAGICAVIKFALLFFGVAVALVSALSKKEPPIRTSQR
jgi:uncharacterized protein YhhL (DUF1145 family)